jgi:predicted CXXCH cytochrome family protein
VDAVSYARWITLSLVTTLAACAWWMAGRRGDGERLAFSHQLHAEQGATCDQCHGKIAEANDLKVSWLPVQSSCTDCHELSTCKVCSQLPKKREAKEEDATTVAFSHKSHTPRVEGDCAKCHGDAKTATELPVERPAMAKCLTCHNHAEEYEASRCTRCHPVLQRMPLEAVAEFSHAGNWIERHGMLSRSEGATCLECHPQAFCTECHSRVAPAAPARLYPEQVARTLIHRGDWLSTHFIDARADGDVCYRCHEANYCQQCHRTWGLVGAGNPSPHLAGWMQKGSANFHGAEARARIETCVACHDQGAASNCVLCHKVGAVGGNPHPAGWTNDHTDTREAVCRACHRS